MTATKNPGVRPARRTAVPPQQHPSSGRGHAYSEEFRQFANIVLANQQLNHPLIQEAQELYLFPSKRTCQRHERRRLELGHFRRFRRTGNKRATVLRGVDNFMLSYWRSVWPKSTIAELNALLFVSQISRGVQNPRFFRPCKFQKQKTG